jgi:hypothetical protein
VLEKMAADMHTLNERQFLAVPRTYHRTGRSEVIDRRSCRIWEAFEGDVKRFEFCVAPKSQIAGSSDILQGMKALSRYWQGSIFALGVKLGQVGWWAGIAYLNGLPILIREFQNGRAISETSLSAIRHGTRELSMFDLPHGYTRTEVAFIP